MRSTMDKLAIKHGTDKSSLQHGYTKTYEPLFSPLRDQPVSILELGWGGHEDPDLGGSSALLWRDYFTHPQRTVSVIDNEPKNLTVKHNGVNFCLGSQADPDFITGVCDQYGPFDIIIDDASHLSSLTIKSFELLWPNLKHGGLYVVEDTHMSYHSHWYGESEANENPMKPPKNAPNSETAMQFLKRLADDAHFKGRDGNDLDLFPRKYWRGYEVDWVLFTFNLCVAKKR